MRHDWTRRIPRGAWAALSVAALSASAASIRAGQIEAPAYDRRACLAWDVHITTQIEDYGSQRTVAAKHLSSAALKQLQARTLCQTGRIREALRYYEEIRFPECAEHPCREAKRQD